MGINIKKQVTSLLAVTGILFGGICPIAFADDTLSISYDAQSQSVEIKGTLDYGKNNRLLAVTVTPKDGGEFAHIDQASVSFDGTYKCVFPFDSETGDYTIAIHCGEIYSEAEFTFGTEDMILEQLNKAETADELLLYIKKFGVNLNLSGPTYKDRLNDEQKQAVLNALCDVNFTKITDVNDDLEKLAFNIALENAGIWQNVEAILRENETLLELDFTDFDKVKEPENVLKKLLKGVNAENVKTVFDNAVAEELKNQDEQKEEPKRPSYGGGGVSAGKVSGTVSVTPVVPAPAKFETSFKDLEEVPWAKEAITYLEEKGIVAGIQPGIFEPMAPVSRAQFVKMLSVAFDFHDPNSRCTFTDVPYGTWYYTYVASAAKKGIVLGRDDGRFGPDDSISRQDMAVFSSRCAQLKGEGMLNFKDASEIAPYALDAVLALSSTGIISGTDSGEFAPTEIATRAQAAKIIYELIQHMNK